MSYVSFPVSAIMPGTYLEPVCPCQVDTLPLMSHNVLWCNVNCPVDASGVASGYYTVLQSCVPHIILNNSKHKCLLAKYASLSEEHVELDYSWTFRSLTWIESRGDSLTQNSCTDMCALYTHKVCRLWSALFQSKYEWSWALRIDVGYFSDVLWL